MGVLLVVETGHCNIHVYHASKHTPSRLGLLIASPVDSRNGVLLLTERRVAFCASACAIAGVAIYVVRDATHLSDVLKTDGLPGAAMTPSAVALHLAAFLFSTLPVLRLFSESMPEPAAAIFERWRRVCLVLFMSGWIMELAGLLLVRSTSGFSFLVLMLPGVCCIAVAMALAAALRPSDRVRGQPSEGSR